MKGHGGRFSEFEGFIDLVGHGKAIIELAVGAEETRDWIRATPPHVLAAYRYHVALDLAGWNMQPDRLRAAIREMEECIRLLPSEATFRLKKGFWLYRCLFLLWFQVWESVPDSQRKDFPNEKAWLAEQAKRGSSTMFECLASLREAQALEPQWKEPAFWLEQITVSQGNCERG
jgi:hypothetical protein